MGQNMVLVHLVHVTYCFGLHCIFILHVQPFSAGFYIERVMGLISTLWPYLPQLVSTLPTILQINIILSYLSYEDCLPASIAVMTVTSCFRMYILKINYSFEFSGEMSHFYVTVLCSALYAKHWVKLLTCPCLTLNKNLCIFDINLTMHLVMVKSCHQTLAWR